MKSHLRVAKIALSAVACVLHTIGFWALWNVKQNNPFMAAQRLYLLNLSVAENIHSLFFALFNLFFLLGYRELGRYMFICGGGGAFVWYITIMIMLTVDRFLTVYLNVRYISMWNKKKTKVVFRICFGLAFSVNLMLILYLKDFEQSLRMIVLFLWFPFDNIFTLTAVITYTYIMVSIMRRKDALRAASVPSTKRMESNSTSSLDNNNKDEQGRKSSLYSSVSLSTPTWTWKTFIVPLFLILVFVFFFGLPDSTYFWFFILGKDLPPWLSVVSFSLYPTGFGLDAIIYIWCSKDVRRFLMKKLSFCCHTDKQTTKNRIDRKNYIKF